MILPPLIAAAFLVYGSYYDIKTREIPDTVWVVMGVTGVGLRVVDHQWKLLLISLSAAVVLGLVLAVSQLFGGADIKALIAISLVVPVYPGTPLFVLSVFNNVVVMRLLELAVVFGVNVVHGNRYTGDVPWWKKGVLYMTGFLRPTQKIDYRFLPLQTTDGQLQLLPDIDMDIEQFKSECTLKEVWVTYGSPLIVYLLLGLIIAVGYGDVFLEVLLRVIG